MNSYDLAIVGGGILGVAILYQAVEQYPNLRVALFDQSLVGLGASFYSAGLSVPLAKKRHIKDLLLDSKLSSVCKEYAKYHHEIESIYIVEKNNRVNFLNSYFGDNLEELNMSQISLLQTYFPDLQVENKLLFRGSNCHYADVYALIRNIVDDVRVKGKADIYETTKIINTDDNHPGYIQLSGETGLYRAKKVIFSLGPWSVNKVSQKVRCKKIVAFHLQNLKIDKNAPVVIFYDEDAFLLPLQEKGYWLLSYTCNEWDVDPSSTLHINAADLQEVQAAMSRFIPNTIKKIFGGRVFCDAYTNDKQPLIDYLKSNKSTLICEGFSGSGYRLAFGAAKKALSLAM